MKTNKLWSIMMMLVLVLGTAITFSSCSKEDEEKEESFSIVGTWIDTKTPNNSSSYYSIVFKSDKTGSFSYYTNGNMSHSEIFEYSYSNGKALITWNGDDDYEIWNVEFFDSKTIMLSGDENGVYYKQ